jgi:DNA polymerase (family 10)
MAKERKVKIIINTDAHNLDQLDFIKYGISTARRGWLEKKDVINTNKLKELKKYF